MYEPIYKTHTKIKAKRLRATTFAIAKLEERLLNREQNEKSNIAIAILEKLPLFKGNKNYFAF